MERMRSLADPDPHNYRIMDFTSEQLIPVAGLTNRRQELPRTEMTAFKYILSFSYNYVLVCTYYYYYNQLIIVIIYITTMYVRAPGSRPVSCRTSLKA